MPIVASFQGFPRLSMATSSSPESRCERPTGSRIALSAENTPWAGSPTWAAAKSAKYRLHLLISRPRSTGLELRRAPFRVDYLGEIWRASFRPASRLARGAQGPPRTRSVAPGGASVKSRHGLTQLIGVDRLHEVGVESRAQCPLTIMEVGVGGDGDDRRRRAPL